MSSLCVDKIFAVANISSAVISRQAICKLELQDKEACKMWIHKSGRWAYHTVGEAGQLLHTWINGHRYDLTHHMTEESLVVNHYNSKTHVHVGSNMVVMAIECSQNHNSCLWKVTDSKWIRTPGTLFPRGMSLRVDGLNQLPLWYP